MLSRLFSLFRRKRLDQELDAEHRYHLESLEAEHLARGLSPDEARAAARRDFGSIVHAQQAYRERRGVPIVETLVQDIRHACRVLRRNGGFACLATMTLAIGIGSTATIFSFVDAVLLKPLPYVNADRIVRLLERRPTGTSSWFSTPAYLEWKANNTAFEKIAAYQQGLATLTVSGDPIAVRVGRVTAEYFNVFGVKALLGRTFAAGEDTPGKHQVVILSHAIWSNQFGRDKEIIGKTITIDNEAYVVIGVLPSDNAFDRGAAQIWYPLAFRPFNMNWDYRWLNAAFAVLKPGVSIDQARRQMNVIGDRIAQQYPNSNKGWGTAVDRYADSIMGLQMRTSLLALMAAVAGLLLICCSNLASLMLVRAVSKEGEVAVRAALGASRVRLLQQLIVEYFVVTIIGSVLGLGLAVTGVPCLTRLLPSGTFPSEAKIEVNARVVAFMLTVALVTGIIFALIPAVRAYRPDLLRSMQDNSRGSTASSGRRRLLDMMVSERWRSLSCFCAALPCSSAASLP